MNEIRIKFRSERGASITFALLLFLVCAVVGSVILVAATAASGRLSQLAESDQRYYSLTSAAELLKGKLHNQSVKVVTEKTTTTTKTYNSAGSESTTPVVTEASLISINGTPSGSYTPDSLLTDAAYKIKVTPGTSFSASNTFSSTFQLTASDKNTSTAYPSLNVTIEEELKKDGTITLTLKNTTAPGEVTAGKVYSLQMVLQAEQAETTDTKKRTGTPTPVSSGGYKIITTETKTTTTIFSWKVIRIGNVMSGT